MQSDDFSINFQLPLPSKMIKSKVICKMEANDRKTNSKEIGSCSVSNSAVCTTLHVYVLTGVWKTILNDTFHVFRNVSAKKPNSWINSYIAELSTILDSFCYTTSTHIGMVSVTTPHVTE